MNEAQRLVVARDQFALKRLSDDALKQILPVYRRAVDNILLELNNLPADGSIQREFWLRNQLNTMERQFKAVEDRVRQVLPQAQLQAWDEGLKNAEAFLRADGISAPVPQRELVGTTAGGQTVTQTGNLPGLGVGRDAAGEFIQPSITRQQVVAAAQDRGFQEFLSGPTGSNKKGYSLDQLLEINTKRQVDNVASTLREGFLLGRTNQDIARRVGDAFGGGKKGRAMTEAVVRTGMAEASQAAHEAFYDANADLLPKIPGGYRWEWDASNDTRLCPICAPKDGLRFKERSDCPEWPAHWGCRCKILPITATQAALRDRGDVPEGSFLERREVKKINGKNEKAPSGWNGDNAYKRPKRIDGKMYWVRRKELPKGQTLAGDMIKRMDDKNKLAILGTKENVAEWNDLIKYNAYKNDPQKLVRSLLGNKGTGGLPPQKPGPRKPPSSGPKPKKPTPKPTPAPAAATPRQGAESERVLRPGAKNELVFQKQGGTGKMFDDSFKLLEEAEGEVGENVRKMRRFMEKQEIVMHPAIPEKFANAERFKGNQALVRAQRKAVEVLEKQGNDPGALNGARSLLKAIEEGDLTELKHVMGKASGAAGYTTRSSGIVNAAMTPSSTTFNKKRIKAIIESAEDSLKRENAYIDFYKPGGGWGTGQTAPKGPWTADGLGDGTLGPDNWLPTSIHEVGHQVHFRGLGGTKLANKYKGLKGERFVSRYSHQNEKEQFAESFVQYVLNPKGLKASHPRLYQWVDDALEEALK